MTCKEIMEKLEERWNPSYALEWDNVGLLVGREEKEIKKIFTALDATEETIAQALEFGADLLITHHPMIFSPVKKVTSADFIGRRLITMIQADLCYYAMHTNFDGKGMAQLNQECLGLTDCEVLEETGLKVKKAIYQFSLPNIYVYSGFPVHTLDMFFLCTVEDMSHFSAMDDVADSFFLPLSEIHPEDFGLDSIRRGLSLFLAQCR